MNQTIHLIVRTGDLTQSINGVEMTGQSCRLVFASADKAECERVFQEYAHAPGKDETFHGVNVVYPTSIVLDSPPDWKWG